MSAQKTRWSKTRIALVISLALNLLVLGTIVGGIARHGDRPPPMPADLTMGPFTDAFEHEDREAMRQRAREEGDSLRKMIRETDADLRKVVAALRQEPWDEAVLRAAIDGMQARLTARTELGERLIFERLGAMSPAQRAAFADRLEERLEHGRKAFEGRLKRDGRD